MGNELGFPRFSLLLARFWLFERENMRRILLFFVLLALFLSACQPESTLDHPSLATTAFGTAYVLLTETAMAWTPTGTPAPPLPTETPAPPTLTPLSTIPVLTPTFDVRTIVTATPASKAECPKENTEIVPGFPYCDARGCSGEPYKDAILSYLNSGGVLDKLERNDW